MYNSYQDAIKKRVLTVVPKDEKTFIVEHRMECTMIDGKVCNVLTDQKYTAACNICRAKPSQMNKMELSK